MPNIRLTSEIISAAIEGYEIQKSRLEDKIAELRAMLDGDAGATAATPEAPARKRKKFSAAARKRMKEAQQRRWAKILGEAGLPAPAAKPEPPKAKRKLSKAGRAAIVAALRKRWAAKKASEAKSNPVAKKKGAVKKAAKKSTTAQKAVKKTAKTSTPAVAQTVD